MKLKSEIEKLEEVDQALRPLYTESAGKFVFTGLEGYDPGETGRLKIALGKERENASAAANALKPYRTLFGETKPEDIRAELDRIEEYKLAAKGKLDESAIEERVNARLGSATKPLERKLAAAEEKAAKAEARVKAFEAAEERAAIRAEAQKAALASSALPEAYADGGGLLAVLEPLLTVAVETDAEGNRKLGKVTGKDGAEVAKIVQSLQQTQGYFWGPSKGGGANGGQGGSRLPAGTNPWKKESRNLTEQMRIARENPALAAQYKTAAGVAS